MAPQCSPVLLHLAVTALLSLTASLSSVRFDQFLALDIRNSLQIGRRFQAMT